MRILLTGGAGYIGSVLTDVLLHEGHEVLIVDRMFFGTDPVPPRPSLRLSRMDTRDLEVDDLLGMDAVIDLAAISNDPAGELDPDLTWQINHAARVRCADLARRAGVRRYILPSSSSVYGQQEGLLDEDASTAPRTAYAEANLAAEEGVLPMASDSFIVSVVRQATVFGLSKRMRFDLALHQMVLQGRRNGTIPVLGDGTQWRPFVHVLDVCEAMRLLLAAPPTAVNGERFNLGGDALNLTIRQLAERVAAAIGVDRFSRYGGLDDRSHRMNFGKIADRVGFVPVRGIEFGARELDDSLRNGSVNPDDARTMTVSWYQTLLTGPAAQRPTTRPGRVSTQ